MLAKPYRLRSRQDINRVFKTGRRHPGRWFNIHYLPNHQSASRATVVVSNKVVKSAVRRNRLRRQLRAVIDEYRQSLTTTIDMVVVVQADFSGIRHQELTTELADNLKAAGLLG